MKGHSHLRLILELIQCSSLSLKTSITQVPLNQRFFFPWEPNFVTLLSCFGGLLVALDAISFSFFLSLALRKLITTEALDQNILNQQKPWDQEKSFRLPFFPLPSVHFHFASFSKEKWLWWQPDWCPLGTPFSNFPGHSGAEVQLRNLFCLSAALTLSTMYQIQYKGYWLPR